MLLLLMGDLLARVMVIFLSRFSGFLFYFFKLILMIILNMNFLGLLFMFYLFFFSLLILMTSIFLRVTEKVISIVLVGVMFLKATLIVEFVLVVSTTSTLVI